MITPDENNGRIPSGNSLQNHTEVRPIRISIESNKLVVEIRDDENVKIFIPLDVVRQALADHDLEEK